MSRARLLLAVYIIAISPARAEATLAVGYSCRRHCEKRSLRRVGKANGSRECAPDDKLRVPTTACNGGHGASAPLPTLHPARLFRPLPIHRRFDRGIQEEVTMLELFNLAAGFAGDYAIRGAL